jgi:hypothetical protein
MKAPVETTAITSHNISCIKSGTSCTRTPTLLYLETVSKQVRSQKDHHHLATAAPSQRCQHACMQEVPVRHHRPPNQASEVRSSEQDTKKRYIHKNLRCREAVRKYHAPVKGQRPSRKRSVAHSPKQPPKRELGFLFRNSLQCKTTMPQIASHALGSTPGNTRPGN